MVWGQVEGFPLTPGLVYRWTDGTPKKNIRKVVWFGDGMVSKVRVQTTSQSVPHALFKAVRFNTFFPFPRLQVHADKLQPYFVFAQCFCPISFATVTTYKDTIFHSLQVRFSTDLYATLHVLVIFDALGA